MRITKIIIEQTIANLLVGHPLRVRADKYMSDAAQVARDIVREHQKENGYESNDAIHAEVIKLHKLAYKCGEKYVDVQVRHDRVQPWGDGMSGYSNVMFYISVAGETRRLVIGGRIDRQTDVEDVASAGMYEGLCAIADGTYMPRNRVDVPAGHWLQTALIKLDAERKDIEGGYKELVNAVTATMSQHTTAKKLVTAWPYIEPFLPKDGAPKTGTGVALNYETLNAICGLPK